MFYATKQNKYIVEGSAFELGGVQYPQNWLNLASAEEKAAIGLVEVTVVGEKKDDRYYWNSETLEGPVLTYTNTPKDLDSLKANATAQINDSVWKILLPTDFMDSRKSNEPDYVAPVNWVEWRASVRATATAAKSAVAAAGDIDELIAATQIEWPHDPNYVEPLTQASE